MILDAQLLLSDAQAITADAGSTNVVDLIASAPNLGDGEPLAIVMTVDVAADGTTTDETYSFVIQTDDNAAFSSAATVSTRAITYGNLTQYSTHIFMIPPGQALERYLRLYYDVGGTTPTITVSAYVAPLSFIQKYKSYADAITIS